MDKKEEDQRMKELKDRYIRFDWAIKRLLRQKVNFGVLEGFLTVFLGEKITIVELLESEGNQLYEDDKFNRVYAEALNDKGEIIIVKIQNIRKLYYLEQVLYGVAKTITEYISLGEDYLYHGQNHFICVHTKDQLVVNTKERSVIVSKLSPEIFPEYILIRINKFDKIAVTPLEEWMDYLKRGTIRPDTMTPGLGEAREKLRYYSMTPEDRYAYDEHLNAVMIQNDVLDSAKLEGYQEGLAESRAENKEKGKAKGLAKGETEANLENAKKMKAMGIDLEMIRQITGITL